MSERSIRSSRARNMFHCVKCGRMTDNEEYCDVCQRNTRALLTEIIKKYNKSGERLSQFLFELFSTLYRTSWFVNQHHRKVEASRKSSSLQTDFSPFRNSQMSTLRTFASQHSLAGQEDQVIGRDPGRDSTDSEDFAPHLLPNHSRQSTNFYIDQGNFYSERNTILQSSAQPPLSNANFGNTPSSRRASRAFNDSSDSGGDYAKISDLPSQDSNPFPVNTNSSSSSSFSNGAYKAEEEGAFMDPAICGHPYECGQNPLAPEAPRPGNVSNGSLHNMKDLEANLQNYDHPPNKPGGYFVLEKPTNGNLDNDDSSSMMNSNEIDDLFNFDEQPQLQSQMSNEPPHLAQTCEAPRPAKRSYEASIPGNRHSAVFYEPAPKPVPVAPLMTPQFTRKRSAPQNRIEPARNFGMQRKASEPSSSIFKSLLNLWKKPADDGLLEPDYLLDNTVRLYFKCRQKLNTTSMRGADVLDIRMELYRKLKGLRVSLERGFTNIEEISSNFNFCLILLCKLFQKSFPRSEIELMNKIGTYFNKKFITSAFTLRTFNRHKTDTFRILNQLLDREL